jgi:hypothetical protein
MMSEKEFKILCYYKLDLYWEDGVTKCLGMFLLNVLSKLSTYGLMSVNPS